MAENPEGHSPRYWRRHPDSIPRTSKADQSMLQPKSADPVATSQAFLAYLRTFGFVAFVLAIGAFLTEYFFWWFVLLFYAGITIALVDCIAEATLGKVRYVIAIFFVLVLVLFSYGFVYGPVRPSVNSEWSPGNYTNGVDVHGVTWQDKWSDLRITVANDNDADLNDVDMQFSIEEDVAQVKSISALCTVVDSDPLELSGMDASGHQVQFPSYAAKHHYRFLCSKIPAHVRVGILAAVADPSSTAKRKPEWVRHQCRYKAKGRPYVLKEEKTIPIRE